MWACYIPRPIEQIDKYLIDQQYIMRKPCEWHLGQVRHTLLHLEVYYRFSESDGVDDRAPHGNF
jgi:hypothetical protein